MGTFYEIGCRVCNQGGKWKNFTDGEGNFRAQCTACGHKVDITAKSVRDQPDAKVMDARMF